MPALLFLGFFCNFFHPDTDSCSFTSTGRNTYFILEPGYQLILEGRDGKSAGRLQITVLPETKIIGGVETRIVEEKEWEDGELVEISRNYFAICIESNAVYYFGEDVDIYKKGKVVSHEGAWLAGGKNKPGIIMPAEYIPGKSYFQENAPGVALDEMKIISSNEIFEGKAGKFTNVLKTEEFTSLEPGKKEYKLYAPGIGLVKEEHLQLISYGFGK